MQRNWHRQKVVIVGAARQGLALARYLARQGARVTLTDRRQAAELEAERRSFQDLEASGMEIAWVLGEHPLSLLDGTDLLCLSGGVSPDIPLAAEARRRGVALSNDSQIFLEAAPCKVIGITGSAGKTTTTSLLGRMGLASLKTDQDAGLYREVYVGGNIGSPLISKLDELQAKDLAVMELSSFQLELMTCSPQVSVITNITPNHLDRHGTMEAYTQAKARILDFQEAGDWAVLNRDDPGAWGLAGRVKGRLASFSRHELPAGEAGAFRGEDALVVRIPDAGYGLREDSLPVSLVELRGEHNLANTLAACAAAAVAGLSLQSMQAGIAGFRGVPHRLEFVRTWGGADWYNDSIATAPERAVASIQSFHEPLVVLAGGRDKKLPWDAFARLAHQRLAHLIAFGESAGLIQEAVASAAREAGSGLKVTRCTGLREAVQAAAKIVQPGQVVLLAPGGTSFDEFRDFEERGQYFIRLVQELP